MVMTAIGGQSSDNRKNNLYDTSLYITAEMAFCIESYIRFIDNGTTIIMSDQFFEDWAIIMLNMMDEDGTPVVDSIRSLQLSIADAKRLRDIVPFEATLGKRQVGYVIHRRLYEALARCREDVVELNYGTIDEGTYIDRTKSKENI